MSNLSKDLLIECKRRLIEKRSELLNTLETSRREHAEVEFGGDEIDQSSAVLAESQFLTQQDRMRKQILEIDSALARIEAGTYGVCEETEESIESDRLLAIPWTRLSIEGAEVRESLSKRFAP